VAGDLIADYLVRLGTGLQISPAAAHVLAEIEDGLRCAAEDHVRRGTAPDRAAELAVAEFGDPEALAAEFVPLLGAAEAHRDGVALLATGPVIGVLWLTSAVLAWPAAPVPVGAGIVAVGLVLVTTVPRISYGVAATGRLGRRLRATPASAIGAVAAAARTAVALDVALVLLALPGLVLIGRSPLPTTLAAVAALLSLARLVTAARATRRLNRFRALLT
jgi:hypothetical protein